MAGFRSPIQGTSFAISSLVLLGMIVMVPSAWGEPPPKPPDIDKLLNGEPQHDEDLPNWDDGTDEKRLLYLRVQSEKTVLSLDNETPSSPFFRLDPEGDFEPNAEASVEFALPEGLSATHFLNLHKPIVGTLWLSLALDSTSTSSSQLNVGGSVRLELYAGNQLVGGNTFAAQGFRWNVYHFHFRPEVRLLDSAEPLTLKITTRLPSSNVVLLVGTDGGYQSSVDAYYFFSDPLAGALYVKEGKILKSVTQEPTFNARQPSCFFCQTQSQDATSSNGWWAFGGLGTLPLLAFVILRRRPPGLKIALLGILLVAPALSGCLGSNEVSLDLEKPTDSTGKNLIQNYDNATLSSSFGFVEGQVLRETIGTPVAQAHVSVPGTTLFTETDSEGRFNFSNVIPNTYTIRVDAEVEGQPLSAEESMVVVAGKMLQLRIILGKGNTGVHQHDYWQGETRRLFQEPFEFAPRWDEMMAQTTGKWACRGACVAKIPIDYSKTVLPGTSSVEVVLEWTSGDFLPAELKLRIKTTTNQSNDQYFLARESGKPFRIAIFPNEADPGHQPFTQWSFEVVLPSPSDPQSPAFYMGETSSHKIKVTIWLHRGVVPFEPAHQDFWEGTSEVLLFEDVKRRSNCLVQGESRSLCDFPNDRSKWSPPPDVFVPPGTKEIRGTLHWVHPWESPVGTSWALAYKPANVPAGEPIYQVAPKTEGDSNSYSFSIKVAPEEADQFYQLASNWIFYPDDLDQPAKGVNTGLDQTTWTLTATAVRDPNYLME